MIRDDVFTYEAARMLGVSEGEVRKLCRNGFLECEQSEIGGRWHVSTNSILRAIQTRLQAVFPGLTIVDLAPPVSQPEPVQEPTPITARAEGRRDISRLIAEGERVVGLGENGYGTGWWMYHYPEGLSDKSATPGRMKDKVETQLLTHLELHSEVRAKLLEHHGLNRRVMYYQVQNGEESHQGVSNPAQAGAMVEDFLNALGMRWCSAKAARKA